MELYIFEDYRDLFPGLKGRALTDALIHEALDAYGEGAGEILRTEKGRPYTVNREGEEEIFFSVSHSGRYFACLVSERPAGVDIQQETQADTEKISRRYFTPEEIRYISERGGDAFFQIWTRKEAYCKYTGRGMQEIIAGTPVTDRDDVAFTDFQIEKGVYCSCCIMI